jgi:hypothetical protein
MGNEKITLSFNLGCQFPVIPPDHISSVQVTFKLQACEEPSIGEVKAGTIPLKACQYHLTRYVAYLRSKSTIIKPN